MLSVFTYPVITAFLEPILLGINSKAVTPILGLMVLVGIYF